MKAISPPAIRKASAVPGCSDSRERRLGNHQMIGGVFVDGRPRALSLIKGAQAATHGGAAQQLRVHNARF